MEPKHEIVIRDSFDLMLHRFQKQLPEPDKKSPEWQSFVNNVRERGVVEPLLITADNLVMGGGRRWRAARQIELHDIPCMVRPENEAGSIVVEGLLQCRHMSRGAAVYIALSLLKEFIESAETRRLANLRKGVKSHQNPLISPKGSNSPSEGTIEELCGQWGIDKKTFARAREVRELFDADLSLKAQYEPQLLSGEKNLWNVLSAAGGADADQSLRTFGVLKKLFKSDYGRHWEALSKGQRAELLQQWRDDAAELPEDMREAIADALMEVAK